MTTIKLKRVYEREAESDGYRILVDRLWPRGIKKENLNYDLWAKDVTPSPELRKWYHEDMQGRWKDFCQKYRKELESNPATRDFLKAIRKHKTVTLLYAAKDEAQNHALILKDFLEKNLSSDPGR